MRLTLDIISSAEQRVGPLKERILSLRGLKIPAIENLGATHDHFDTIDLCDNDLIKLENFPPLRRLRTLLVANNRITKLDADFLHNLPQLSSLVLTNNKIAHLGDLAPLTKGQNLQRLTLVDNPVASHPHYRAYLIYAISSLRFIDFQRVRDAERIQAKSTFRGTAGAALLSEITATTSSALVSQANDSGVKPTTNGTEGYVPDSNVLPVMSSGPGGPTVSFSGFEGQSHLVPPQIVSHLPPVAPQNHGMLPSSLSSQDVALLQDAMATATSLADVKRFEEALVLGVLPPDLQKVSPHGQVANGTNPAAPLLQS